MNPLQLAQQIRHKLRIVTWDAGSEAVVFGDKSVSIVAGRPTENDLPHGFPFAMVSIDSGTADEVHPEYISQRFTVLTATSVMGDRIGEQAIAGGPAADIGKSAGRGVGELSERVRSAVSSLTGADGARLMVSLSSTGAPQAIGRGRHLVMEEHTVTGLCTADEHFAEPQQLKVDGGVWTWSGAHCKNRFDFLQFRLGFRRGEPAVKPSDFGVVIVGGTSDYYMNHAPESGMYYSIWADYDPRGTSTAYGSSDGSLVGAYVKT